MIEPELIDGIGNAGRRHDDGSGRAGDPERILLQECEDFAWHPGGRGDGSDRRNSKTGAGRRFPGQQIDKEDVSGTTARSNISKYFPDSFRHTATEGWDMRAHATEIVKIDFRRADRGRTAPVGSAEN